MHYEAEVTILMKVEADSEDQARDMLNDAIATVTGPDIEFVEMIEVGDVTAVVKWGEGS